MDYPVKVLGFGDNVVDLYDHLHLMYPGGNAVNFVARRLNGLAIPGNAFMIDVTDDQRALHPANASGRWLPGN